MTTHAKPSLLRRGHLEWTVGVSISGWLLVVVAAWSYLMLYDFSSGGEAQRSIASHWPSESRIERRAGRPTLLLFLHPKCPCSRATVRELERVLANLRHHATGLVIVTTLPAGESDSWCETVTVTAAHRLPNAELFLDRGGLEAARFGATVSGQLILFDDAGNRAFAGGVTASRGHEGANSGAEGLTAVLHQKASPECEFPVFGCRLCLPDETVCERPAAAIAATTPERNP